MKIEKLKDGFKFRAWVGRERCADNEDGEYYGSIWTGKSFRIETDKTYRASGWQAESEDRILTNLASWCPLGKRFLERVDSGKKRRVEITVRFV